MLMYSENYISLFCLLLLLLFNILMGKWQIIPIKFRNVRILYPEISKFRFYPLKFESVWILHSDVSEFGIYPLNFRGVWILPPKV